MQFAPPREKLKLDDNEVRYYTRQVERVRIASIEKEPFLADNGFRMKIVIANYHRGQWIDTAGTDGKVLVVNPNWYMMKTVGGQVTVFAHELFHAALGHNLRRGKRNPKLWNVACDHEVNNLLVASGKYELPSGQLGDTWVCDPKYAGWACERIYADLKKNLDDQPKPPPTQPPPPGGDEPGWEECEDDGEEDEPKEPDNEGSEDSDEEDEEADGGKSDAEECVLFLKQQGILTTFNKNVGVFTTSHFKKLL